MHSTLGIEYYTKINMYTNSMGNNKCLVDICIAYLFLKEPVTMLGNWLYFKVYKYTNMKIIPS